MATLSGETIKNAIARELSILYPDIAVYKEEQTTPFDFPHFFILQLNVASTEDRKDRYFITYIMNLRYRQVADVELEPRIEQELDSMGVDLITNFVKVTIDNKPYKLKERYYEKVDKVLHFSCQVKVQVEKEKLPTAKQESLSIDINTNIGGI